MASTSSNALTAGASRTGNPSRYPMRAGRAWPSPLSLSRLRSERRVHRAGGRALGFLKDVSVRVERQGHGRVADHLADDRHVHFCRAEQGHAAMPEVVETEFR